METYLYTFIHGNIPLCTYTWKHTLVYIYIKKEKVGMNEEKLNKQHLIKAIY